MNVQRPPQPDQPDELLETIADAFEQAELPPRPDDAETLQTLESQLNGDHTAATRLVLSASPATDLPPASHSPRWIMRTLAPLAAAAAVLLALTVVLWAPSGFDSNAVFAQAVRQVRAAQTMAFTMTMGVPNQDAPMSMRATIKNPASMRVEAEMKVNDESFAMVQIFDYETQQMITLLEQQKLAQKIDMAGLPRGDNPRDMISEFTKLDPEEVEYLRDEPFNGVDAHVYAIDAGAIKGRAWIDADTNLPLRWELGNPTLPDDPNAKIVMDNFRWDVAVDDAMFDMTIPDGYQVREMDMSNAQPEDFAMMLRLYAALSEQPFPTEFGPETLTGLPTVMMRPGMTPEENHQRLVKVLTPIYGEEALTGEAIGPTMEQLGVTMGRGAIFLAGLAETAEDWRWVGGGATAGDSDVPLCGWKPKDGETYRVVYNDFTIREVAPDALPEAFLQSEGHRPGQGVVDDQTAPTNPGSEQGP